MGHQVALSILDADHAKLYDEIKIAEKGSADSIHIDILDGQFAPTISFGHRTIASLRSRSPMPFDAHLMVQNPEDHIQAVAEAGANLIYVHLENQVHLHKLVQQIRSVHAQVGIAINPSTSLYLLDEVLDSIEEVLMMSVNPGFGYQHFIPSTIPKLTRLKHMIDHKELDTKIAIDGGINTNTGKSCINAGADKLVIGSFVYQEPSSAQQLKALQAMQSSLSLL